MINKKNITDLFFDLDHTLWDFETNSQHTFASILAPYAFPFTIEKFMEAYTPINHAYWKLYRENKISIQLPIGMIYRGVGFHKLLDSKGESIRC